MRKQTTTTTPQKPVATQPHRRYSHFRNCTIPFRMRPFKKHRRAFKDIVKLVTENYRTFHIPSDPDSTEVTIEEYIKEVLIEAIDLAGQMTFHGSPFTYHCPKNAEVKLCRALNKLCKHLGDPVAEIHIFFRVSLMYHPVEMEDKGDYADPADLIPIAQLYSAMHDLVKEWDGLFNDTN